MSTVTTAEIEAELKRLGAVYKPPTTSPEKVATVWADVLQGIGPRELHDAVSEYLRGVGRYFPRPAEIRAMAVGVRGHDSQPQDLRTRWNRWTECHGDPCPVCGARLTVLEAHWGVPAGDIGRFGTLHDLERHSNAGIQHAGYPLDGEYVKNVNTAMARLFEERRERMKRGGP